MKISKTTLNYATRRGIGIDEYQGFTDDDGLDLSPTVDFYDNRKHELGDQEYIFSYRWNELHTGEVVLQWNLYKICTEPFNIFFLSSGPPSIISVTVFHRGENFLYSGCKSKKSALGVKLRLDW